MIEFKDITLADKDLIQSFTLGSLRRNCDLSFANLCSWIFLYQTKYAVMDNYLLLRFYAGEELAYMMPVGTGDVKPVLEALIKDAEEMGAKLRMLGVCVGMKADIEAVMPGRFTFTEDRDYFDYIYLRTDLATLKGKKFQAKRNHINKFKKQYPDYEFAVLMPMEQDEEAIESGQGEVLIFRYYEYKPLTPDLVPECLKLEEEWCRANNCEEQLALGAERKSMTYALNHMEALGLTGGVLHVNGKIAAFTYGAPINHETWDTCVEKADTGIEGSYAMINYEYANHIDEQYIYVNREEDLGLEGLRKAKLSYQPVILLEKCIAELNDHKR